MPPPVRCRRRAGKLLDKKVSLLRAEIKGGVQYSATYVKDTAVSGTRAVKERDWSKEKKLAQDAGVATKECAPVAPDGHSSGLPQRSYARHPSAQAICALVTCCSWAAGLLSRLAQRRRRAAAGCTAKARS